MPTLQFKGRNIIWNHHLSVPYHTLNEEESLDFSGKKGILNFDSRRAANNIIVEGDNLIALKALLPQYTGLVKCIYIDPPYNTGNEGWVYNDNVNSPMINDWLGKTVAKDDMTRHDKWLCMMTPRLKLLRELLSDKGAIFISLDDNELHNCIGLCNEIFGEDNFRNIIVIRRGIKSVQAQFETVDKLNFGFEYVLCYTKNSSYRFKKFEIELENGKDGGWNNHWRGTDRRTMRYELFGIKPNTGQWRWGEQRSRIAVDNYNEMVSEFKESKIELTQENIDAYYTKNLEETGEELDFVRLSNNDKPEHYVPPTDSRLASNLWSDLKPNGSSQLKAIFKKKVFENPKSTDLIKRIIRFAEGDEKDIIVLDSFAGSGTTGHAVLDLNKEDGGNRKFILIQMPENTDKEPNKNICRDITRERVKKSIEKYGYDGMFKYLKVGDALDSESLLSGNLPTYLQFAKYVYHICTGENLTDIKKIDSSKFFVASIGSTVIYLVYQQNYDELSRLALNLSLAEQIRKDHPKKKAIVYAPACFLDEEYLDDHQIHFVSIPYNLFQQTN